MYADTPGTFVVNLEIRALSDHEWRVRDRSKSEGDANSVLGVIERVGEVFTVLTLSAPPVTQTFRTFVTAVDSISRSRYATA